MSPGPTAITPAMGCSDLAEQIPSSTTCHTDSSLVLHIHNLPPELLGQILLLSLTRGAWDLHWGLFGVASITRLRSNWGNLVDFGKRFPEYPEFWRFIELIGRHTDRWKSLFIYAFDYELIKLLECLDGQQFSKLENLEIRRWLAISSFPEWILFGTPKLRRLALDGCMMPSNFSSFRTLAILEVAGEILALDLLVAVIQGSENLEELVLSDIEFEDDTPEFQMDIGWPDESRPTSLPQLKKIRIISFQSTPAVTCVLKCIHTPNIADVLISEGQGNEDPGGSEIIRALTLHIERQSMLTWMLCEASRGASLELEGFEEHMTMTLKDPAKGLYFRPSFENVLIIHQIDIMDSRSESHRSPLAPDPQGQPASSAAILYENIRSPRSAHINNLPTEILVRILLFCLIKIEETAWEDYRFGMVSLERLRSVCVRWHDAMLGEPTLWTHIDIRVESSSAVRLKLLRSGALPLTIRYFNTEGIFDSERRNPEFYTIMDLIGAQTHRWKSISFWALDPELEHMIQYLQESPPPELEYLKIRRNSVSPDYLNWTLGETAELRSVVLDGGALPWNCSELRSLVHIEIEGAIEYLDLLVDVIQASQSLETLSLRETIFTDGDVEEQQRIGWPDESHPPLLPRLRDINISGLESPAAIACVLRCIRVPNLTRLDIFETYTEERQAASEITRALTTYHGDESILVSMLHNISPSAKLELRCSQEFMYLELDDPVQDLSCSLEFSLLHADCTVSAGMIADVVRGTDATVRLKIGNVSYTVIAPFLLCFSMAKELEFTDFDMPIEEILPYLHALSQPIILGEDTKAWVCPQLEELRLSDKKKTATELFRMTEAATLVKQARRDFKSQSSGEGDGSNSDEVYGGIRVMVGYLDFE
ncbi:hypothetical protein FRC01_004652 [Tulasnella sp. 417]|nr:hypothetical protein FRC01_004652 [Tulasnella sp. 417]